MTTNRFHDDANDLVHDLVHDRLFGCASALQTALGNLSNVYVYIGSAARAKVQRCGEAGAPAADGGQGVRRPTSYQNSPGGRAATSFEDKKNYKN